MNIAHKINDRIIILISVPLIAIIFPNISGLIINSRYSLILLLLQYCYFIFLVYILWKGNILVILLIKSKLDFDKIEYVRYILAILFSTIIYAVLIVGGMLKIWTILFKENATVWHTLLKATLILSFIATFITMIYENYLLNRKKLSALSKVERMNLAQTQAELSVLKSQIDPHFIFNSLNTLSYLISSNPANAKLYNDTLAKVYQYILINKEKDLVLLKEEIEFISNYFYLLRIRFDNAIRMKIEINNLETDELLIPPISLQILIENAIKHNEFDDDNPLLISVCISSSQIIVSNRIKYKSFLQPTSKIGLTNLDNRYRLITNRNISIDTNQFFTVKLPLINL
ncbi:MAG: sensor histidine kinase [Ginsengibacter sp.]